MQHRRTGGEHCACSPPERWQPGRSLGLGIRARPHQRLGGSRASLPFRGRRRTSVLAVTGITNKSLRALMTGLLGGANYSMNQASYDLARLRVNGLISRIPAKNRYRLTSDGLRFAIFYTKLHNRLLRPLLGADQPPASP